jgi:DNA-binding CsgD family transcriptional regulator
MNICRCGPKFTKTPDAKHVPWPSDWPDMRDVDEPPRVWVCGSCGKPAFAIPKGHEVLRAPVDAVHLFSAEGQRDGVWLTHWQTPRGRVTTMSFRPYPRRPAMPDSTVNTEPLLLQMWELLDSKCEIIMTADPLDNMIKAAARERTQNEARGLAEGIAIVMYPFMENADAVVREAVKRFKARQAGTVHETPGLGEHMFDPHFNHDGTPRVAVARPTPRTAVKAPTKPAPEKILTDAEKDTIKTMLAGKMLSPDELAKMFGVSITTIVQLG